MQKESTIKENKDESKKVSFRPIRVLVTLIIVILLLSGAASAFAVIYKKNACTQEARDYANGVIQWLATISKNDEIIELASNENYREVDYQSFYETCMETSALLKSLFYISERLNV